VARLARGDAEVAAACLQAFRDGTGSTLDDAGARLVAGALHDLRELAPTLLAVSKVLASRR